MADSDDHWMRQAIAIAVREKGTDPANTPIAALLVRGGALIASGVNQTAECCEIGRAHV